jgi:hypothetical protein
MLLDSTFATKIEPQVLPKKKFFLEFGGAITHWRGYWLPSLADRASESTRLVLCLSHFLYRLGISKKPSSNHVMEAR